MAKNDLLDELGKKGGTGSGRKPKGESSNPDAHLGLDKFNDKSFSTDYLPKPDNKGIQEHMNDYESKNKNDSYIPNPGISTLPHSDEDIKNKLFEINIHAANRDRHNDKAKEMEQRNGGRTSLSDYHQRQRALMHTRFNQANKELSDMYKANLADKQNSK